MLFHQTSAQRCPKHEPPCDKSETYFATYHREGYSKRLIGDSLHLARATVRKYLCRAEVLGLRWPLPDGLTDDVLEAMFFPESRSAAKARYQPDWEAVNKQMSRKHVTLRMVWESYHAAFPDGYSYSHFCALYKTWSASQEVVMRLEHKAGDKLFVDFAGTTVNLIHPVTGKATKAQIFVATLGCSNFTYAEAVPDQSLCSWITAHARALSYFGAVPKAIVCDNLKAAVKKAHRYDPELNPTYQDFATYYDTSILPARVRKPRDKSLESGCDL